MGTDNTNDNVPREALAPAEQDSVPFYGRTLVAVRLHDGRICVVLRWICEGLNLNVQAQLRRILRQTALTDGLVSVRVQTEGGPQVMPALTLDVLPGWLFGIDENRVKPETRPDVIVFQRECVKVLAQHFASKQHSSLPQPGAPVPSESMIEPAPPGRDASRAEWAEWRRGMRAWLDWQDQMDAWREESERQHQALAQRQDILEQRQDALEDRVEGVEALSQIVVAMKELLGPKTLTTEHQATVRAMAARLHDLGGFSFGAIYGELNASFHVAKYSDIPDDQWERVSEWFQARIASAERRQGR